jgi:kynureninase
MGIGFHELHATVNCAIGFTYKYLSADPGCVIGGGLARLATCFEETVVCNWTGWTGFFNNYG